MLPSPTPPIEAPADLLTTATAAQLLGCSAQTVLNLVQAGHLPAFRLGPGASAYRIRRADLLAFLDLHQVQPGQDG